MIDIKLTRGLIVALSCVLVAVGLLAYLMLTGERAVASEMETAGEASSAQSTGMRQFYLTPTEFKGNEVLTRCVAGYHMASIWEITDPSNLKYNTALGYTRADSGQGPPTNAYMAYGWVRTGYASTDTGPIGQANCLSWTSVDPNDDGTVAGLPPDWTAGWQDMGVWDTGPAGCSLSIRVWCIED